MISAENKRVYSQLLAGRLPVGRASIQEVVFNHVYGLTGQKNLHFHAYRYGGFVYFFAVESKVMSSSPTVHLPFASCLPGLPGHQGDGVYLLADDDFAVAMWMEGTAMRLLCNDVEIVREALLENDLPVFNIKHDEGPTLGSAPQQVFGLSEIIGKWVMRSSLATLGISCVALLGVQTISTVLQTSVENEGGEVLVERELNETLKDLSVQQPLARQIARVQKVAATTVRAGGWIQSYKLSGEEDEVFEVVLPSWVSQDYLDSLGRDVVTDLKDLEGLLTVRKGDKEAER